MIGTVRSSVASTVAGAASRALPTVAIADTQSSGDTDATAVRSAPDTASSEIAAVPPSTLTSADPSSRETLADDRIVVVEPLAVIAERSAGTTVPSRGQAIDSSV